MIRNCSAALAILFVSSPSLAQTNAENVQTRVKDGQRMSITDDEEQEFKGRIGIIAADGLRMLVDGKSVDVAYRPHRPDRSPQRRSRERGSDWIGCRRSTGTGGDRYRERLRSGGNRLFRAGRGQLRSGHAVIWAAWAPLLASGSMPSSTATARSTGAVPARTQQRHLLSGEAPSAHSFR